MLSSKVRKEGLTARGGSRPSKHFSSVSLHILLLVSRLIFSLVLLLLLCFHVRLLIEGSVQCICPHAASILLALLHIPNQHIQHPHPHQHISIYPDLACSTGFHILPYISSPKQSVLLVSVLVFLPLRVVRCRWVVCCKDSAHPGLSFP